MRDVLLKAEKWTKNRYIARAEFPNLVIHYRVTFSQPVRVIWKKHSWIYLSFFYLIYYFKKNEKLIK